MNIKVQEIRDILNPDQLALDISSKFSEWNYMRQEWLDDKVELRNFLFAESTRDTQNSTLPWKNNTRIPKLTQIRDGLHALYMATILPNGNIPIKWEGHNNDGVAFQKNKIITSYIQDKLRLGGFREFVSDTLYDYIDYGNSFGDVQFVNEYKELISGERVDSFIGPKFIRVDPYDHVFNPVACNYCDSPKITRVLITIGELKLLARDRPDLEYYQEALEKIDFIRGKILNRSGDRESYFRKDLGLQIDGFESYRDYLGSGLVELLVFEGNIYDQERDELLRNYRITVADRVTLISKVVNPSWIGKDSKQTIAWRKRPNNLYGQGPLDLIVGMQYRVDHLENAKADAIDQYIHPIEVMTGDVRSVSYGPGARVQVGEDGRYELLRPELQGLLQYDAEINYYLAMMEQMAGLPPQELGFRTPGEKTAFEVAELKSNAFRLFLDRIIAYETQFLEPLLNHALELSVRNLQGKDLVRVLNEDGAAIFVTITKDDITAKGKIRPIGARRFANNAIKIQQLTALSNTPLWAKIEPDISSQKLINVIQDWLDLEQYDLFEKNSGIFEMIERQRVLQTGTQQLEEESLIDIQEELPLGLS